MSGHDAHCSGGMAVASTVAANILCSQTHTICIQGTACISGTLPPTPPQSEVAASLGSGATVSCSGQTLSAESHLPAAQLHPPSHNIQVATTLQSSHPSSGLAGHLRACVSRDLLSCLLPASLSTPQSPWKGATSDPKPSQRGKSASQSACNRNINHNYSQYHIKRSHGLPAAWNMLSSEPLQHTSCSHAPFGHVATCIIHNPTLTVHNSVYKYISVLILCRLVLITETIMLGWAS